MRRLSAEFCENRLSTFCIILQTNKRRRWKHNLLGG